jgi:predicted dehydrogenase
VKYLSKTEVGVGIIGLGFVGEKAHVPSFRKIPGAKLVAVADIDVERAKIVAEKAKVKTVYSNHKDLIADPNVNAVVVSVPTFLHPRLAIDAMRAGKHVLSEVPLAPTMSEAKEMVEESKKAGVILMPGLNFRFTPNFVKVKSLIDKNAIGKPVAAFYREFIPATVLAEQWPANSWAWDDKKTGGGPGFTLSVWSIDLLRWLFGAEVVEVHSAWNEPVLPMLGGTKGYCSLSVLKFSNGLVATLQFSGLVRPIGGISRLEILGDNTNSLTATNNDSVTLCADEPDEQHWTLREPGPRVWGHYQEDEHFVNCIANHKQPIMTGEDALKAQDVATKIRQR